MKTSKIDVDYFEKLLSSNELKNWLSKIFYDRLGLKPQINYSNGAFHFSFKQENLFLNLNFTDLGRCQFFNNSEQVYYVTNKYLEGCDLGELIITDLVLYGVDYCNWFCRVDGSNSLTINYDFPSYVVWTLNRIEEYGQDSIEKHSRFELSSSHLRIDNLYKRPIIDEWIFFIGNLLNIKGFKITRNSFSYEVSHDVDEVSRYESVPLVRKSIVFLIDSFKRPKQLLKYFLNKQEFLLNEDSNTFKWLMDVSDRFNIISKFYFIAGNTSFRYDYRYKLKTNHVKALFSDISNRGHKIGIHYSYNSSIKKNISKEWRTLNSILSIMGLDKIDGGRMHYLRINFYDTLMQLDSVNQQYDNTLTFHETGGFRSGTCRPYKPFDIFNMKEFGIEIHPLIIMEGSVLGYSEITDHKRALDYIIGMIDKCYSVGGCFSMLWHNSDLQNQRKDLYLEVLNYCSQLNLKDN
jgi:hypothetical protein